MKNITKRLRQLVEVYGTKKIVNELGENDTIPILLKKAYCEILPINSTVKDGKANTETNEHQFKLTFRRMSIKDIQKDWYFIFENLKYEVIYFNRDFKDNQFIEVFCTRREE